MTEPAIVKVTAVSATAGIGSMFATADFKGTITLGSVIVGLLILAVGGVFAVRNQQARSATDAAATWRLEAEAHEARADRLAEELAAAQAERQTFEREQQELRHQLKDELSGIKAQLKVEEAKHDLGALLERMQSFHAEAMQTMQTTTGTAVDSMAAAIDAIGSKLDENQVALLTGQDEQKQLLSEIRDSLRRSER